MRRTSVRRKVEAVSVEGSIARSKVTRTVPSTPTPVAPGAGWRSVIDGAPVASTVRPASTVDGRASMSASTFTVACLIVVFGSPWSNPFSARPRLQSFVPVEKTTAPLAAL